MSEQQKCIVQRQESHVSSVILYADAAHGMETKHL